MKGILLLAAGAGIAIVGVCGGLDAAGVTTRFYRYTIRSWSKIPMLGQMWIRMTPYSTFRLQASIPFVLFGIILIVIGAHFLASAA
jgi:hypothetical protein